MTIETLLAEREIYRHLVQFARAMDERNWEAIKAVTTNDIKGDYGTGEVSGQDAVIELIRSYLDHCGTTQHILGNVLISINGDTATSESYVADMHLGKEPQQDLQFRTLGNYSDKWIKQNGKWLMCQRDKDNRALIGSMEVFEPKDS